MVIEGNGAGLLPGRHERNRSHSPELVEPRYQELQCSTSELCLVGRAFLFLISLVTAELRKNKRGSQIFCHLNVYFIFFPPPFYQQALYILEQMCQSIYCYWIFHSVQNKLRRHFPSRKRHLRFWISIRKSLLLLESSSIFWLALYPLCTYFP